MNKYELMYIISAGVQDDKREEIINKVKAFVESKGGVVAGLDKLGMKKFAYQINFKSEGFYVVMNFEAPATVIAELNNNLNLNENVVRQVIIRK